MPKGMLGKKIGMTQFFDEAGNRVGVTVLELPANRVLQVKTEETDGYTALQLGVYDRKEKHTTRAEAGHARKAGGPCRFVKEIRTEDAPEAECGAEIALGAVFDGVAKVKVTGTSKGKGFAGVIKRHHFGGFRATHGVKTHHRHPGSIGQCQDPGRVFKGKKMAGQLGNKQISTKGLKVVKLLPEKNLMLVKGAVPGANGSYVIVVEDVGYVAPKKK
ncbi:MAG: 50S ribosomal protein L3 [Planctomycetota bacterium]